MVLAKKRYDKVLPGAKAMAWGPRYLIPVLPFIIIMLGSIFPRLNRLFFLKILAILCVVGFYVLCLSAVLLWFQYGITYGWEKQGLANRPDSLEIMTWNLMHSPIVLHSKALID